MSNNINCTSWKKYPVCVLLLCLFTFLPLKAQTAQQVLDKTANIVSNKTGITASFILRGGQMNDKGTIDVKGRKFHATTPDAIIWFDGKTQWTYIKRNDEVNVSTPTAAQAQTINPYNLIYMYRQGYDATLVKKGTNYEIHLTTKDKKQQISEMYVTVNQKTYIPSQIKLKHAKGWNTIDISNFKKANLPESTFRFNAKEFPSAEIIDLR